MDPQGNFEPPAFDTDSTSLTLLEGVKSQDQAAWERLVGLYSPLVLSWGRQCGLGREDCADVLQDVFAAVAASIADFRRERPGDTFRGWLRVVVRNRIRLHFRRRGQQPVGVGGSTAQMRVQQLPDDLLPDPEPDDDARERSSLSYAGLELIRAQFEERTWRAFWLTAVESRPSPEVAVELNMSGGAVRQAKYKVLRRLRRELGDLLD